MDRIYAKAQREQTNAILQEILDKLDALPSDTSDWKGAVQKILDESIQRGNDKTFAKAGWDFSSEKSQDVFTSDSVVVLRPITTDDLEFYRFVRIQYSQIHRSVYNSPTENKMGFVSREALAPEVFYCIIETAQRKLPIGYLGIKDTSAMLWELAIELDGKATHQGFGLRSIRLYLNEIQRITGKSEYKAAVEVDNIPSQKCFESLGAKLVGLCNSAVLKTEEEKERFESQNLDLIDDHIISLAQRLQVDPRKLLSHVLDYRLICPLGEPMSNRSCGT